MISIDSIREGRRNLQRSFVEHSVFKETLDQLTANLTLPVPGRVYLLVGLPGFGVTSIAQTLRSRLCSESHPFNPYQALLLDAQIASGGDFSFGPLFEQGLRVLNEPIVGQKVRATDAPDRLTNFAATAVFRGASKLRPDFELAMVRRNVSTLIVTHAHRMRAGLADSKLGVPFDVVAQVLNGKQRLPACALLSGTPDLLRMRLPQTGHYLRSKVFCVAPKSLAPDKYIEMMAGYEALLKGLVEPGALTNKDNAMAFHTRTSDSAGWVKSVLGDALADLEREPKKPLTWARIERHLPPKKVTALLDREVKEFEQAMRDFQDSGGTEEMNKPAASTSGKKPFERKAGNDPVGGA